MLKWFKYLYLAWKFRDERKTVKKLKELFDRCEKIKIEHFSKTKIEYDMISSTQGNLKEYPCIFVNQSDLTKLGLDAEFSNYFDPQTRYDQLCKGYVGSFLGTRVLSDAFFYTKDKFLTDSYIVFARRSEILELFR